MAYRHINPNRIWFLVLLILLISSVIITKLYLVQIVKGKEYADRAEHQYVRPVNKIFERGNIYFTQKDGNLYTAATTKPGFTLAINSKDIKDPEKTYQTISNIIDLKKEDFLKAYNKGDSYEEILKRLDQDRGKKIDDLKLPGIILVRDKWRIYPGGQLAANVIGFVGYKGNDLVGRYGLEYTYQEILKRKSESLYVNFFAELFSNLGDTLSKSDTVEGDLVTTIEPQVQIFLEQQLKEFQTNYDPELTGGVVTDPNTGEIYAMAIHPSFDPNSYNTEKDLSRFTNRMVEGSYEMGSIIKPLTMAAGLDSGAVRASTTYKDEGSIKLDGYTVSNFDKKARGIVSMQEVLNQSLNLGAYFVASKMGKQSFAEYIKKYGITGPTGIDLPNEAKGKTDNLKNPKDVELATASFGQGISMTPISAVRALSSLANGGYIVQPHIVKKIVYPIGTSKEIQLPPPVQILKSETSREISRMLTNVVDVALKKGAVKMEHYTISAKTGTAQISNPGGKGYYTDRFLHSFFGYFPATNPRFLVFYYTVYPKNVQYASETLTNPFMEMTKYLINYYNIAPDR